MTGLTNGTCADRGAIGVPRMLERPQAFGVALLAFAGSCVKKIRRLTLKSCAGISALKAADIGLDLAVAWIRAQNGGRRGPPLPHVACRLHLARAKQRPVAILRPFTVLAPQGLAA